MTYLPGTTTPCIQNLNYSNNDACSFGVYSTVQLNVIHFSTEPNFDYLYVNQVGYSGTNGPQGVRVAAGSTIYWRSDCEGPSVAARPSCLTV